MSEPPVSDGEAVNRQILCNIARTAFEVVNRLLDRDQMLASQLRPDETTSRQIYREECITVEMAAALRERFGMVARELGYLVEAVQAGFPDCEAKRRVDAGKWQRVRIEFEFESRNFRVHGHPADGCDIIVCWRHNWPDCPPPLEIVELSEVIRTLSASEE